MLPKRLIKGFDKNRLRILLAIFFLTLAAPTAVLIWQAYGQLKWEAFHQYRNVAEELTTRIDTRLNEMIGIADARSFADYTFLVVSGEPSANFLQRSPLAAYPVTPELPGVIGYFQVDADGAFSTPLLPPAGTEPASLGIGAAEYSGRLELAGRIHAVLVDNRLVQSRPGLAMQRGLSSLQESLDTEQDFHEGGRAEFRDRQAAVAGALTSGTASGSRPAEESAAPADTYSQVVFDRLNSPLYQDRYSATAMAPTGDESDEEAAEERLSRIGKVSELNLDPKLQMKSEQVERDEELRRYAADGRVDSPSRSKRREQIALPESVAAEEEQVISNVRALTDLRISTFESEIDPFEFSLLDSGHLVLFRKVWREGERYIQGLLLDQHEFTASVVGERFMKTALADMSNLIVAYQDDVIDSFTGSDSLGYPNVAEGLDGALLYRSRLTAPLDSLELIFSIQRLPPGAGGDVLAWVTVVLAIVLVGGFVTLYQLGLGQIDLAQQQQDFVSAVSHELKTPLTSIRMYGEMLKEGWADEKKRQSYYEFIHDESERLSRLISNVLQLASITRNEPQFDLRPTTVAELLRNTESKISSQIERAGFELRVDSSDDTAGATISVDQDCFMQIVINLVDNAIKFSQNADEKVIEIHSRRIGDDRVRFSVRDFGPGIPRDQMKKIFRLFYRSESELTRETVGTGIGLAIVHQLTLAMNGSADMVNVEPGAEFRVTFPSVD